MNNLNLEVISAADFHPNLDSELLKANWEAESREHYFWTQSGVSMYSEPVQLELELGEPMPEKINDDIDFHEWEGL